MIEAVFEIVADIIGGLLGGLFEALLDWIGAANSRRRERKAARRTKHL